MDRRADDRRADERRTTEAQVDGERRQSTRRKVQRRRQIDPTTCERDYTGDEIEFMQAMDDYKRASGRMFPTCSEILEVVRNLGYQKVTGAAAESEASPDSTDTPDESADAIDSPERAAEYATD